MQAEGKLLTRLDRIGAALAREDGALAQIGVGSCGLEIDRLDAACPLVYDVDRIFPVLVKIILNTDAYHTR